MSAFVLDTSVAVAWYLPEIIAEKALQWREQLLAGRHRFLVPGLHYWEIANVLRTYTRRGEIEESFAKRIFSLHLQAPLKLAEPQPADVLEMAFEYGATAYDAVYIALALGLDLPLLTAEKRSRPWVARMGDQVVVIRPD